jgi:hypothetical protein
MRQGSMALAGDTIVLSGEVALQVLGESAAASLNLRRGYTLVRTRATPQPL